MKHLQDLKAEMGRWVEGGYTIRVEPDPKPFETDYEVRAYITEQIGEDPFSLLIGDFLQNARAALDYIAYALGEAGAGGAMPENVAIGTGFPIIGDVDRDGFSGRGPDLFAAAADRQLATVPEPARGVIESLQPYYEGGVAWRWQPLWVLHELARLDRHRFFHLAVVRTGEVRPDPAIRSNMRIRGDIATAYGAQVIEDEPWREGDTPGGAVLARFTAAPVDPGREMRLRFLADLQLGFVEDTLPESLGVHPLSHDVDTLLTEIATKVRQAIRALRPCVPSSRPL